MKTEQLYLVSVTPRTGVHGRWSFITVVKATSKANAIKLAIERDSDRFGRDANYRKAKAELLVQGGFYAV